MVSTVSTGYWWKRRESLLRSQGNSIKEPEDWHVACVKLMASGKLLHKAGHWTQWWPRCRRGREAPERGVNVYLPLLGGVVQQRPAKHCKVVILQWNEHADENITSAGANWDHTPHGGTQRTQHRFCNIPTKEARLFPKSNPGETSNQTQTEGHSIQVWPIIFKSVKGIKNKGKDELLQNEAARRGRTPYTWVTLNWISLLGKGGESNGTPLQHCCLENPMEGGAW